MATSAASSKITFPENLPPDWKAAIGPLAKESFFKKLLEFLKSEDQAQKITFPAKQNIFRAFESLALGDVKAVIFGQDPYHGPNQAIGFSFAVPNDHLPKPPSLKNIFKELESDLDIHVSKDQSDLSGWAEQGVLLLNTVLTVHAGEPFSHREQGWEQFTDRVIEVLNSRKAPIVFVLWGSHAQKLKSRIDLKRHAVLESAHPSPLSAYRGFFGSKIFSKINAQLKRFGETPIDWARVSSSGHKEK